MNLVFISWFPKEEFARATLYAFYHDLRLKHIYLVTPSDILQKLNQPYSYYLETQNWQRSEVDVNVLNLLATDLRSPLSLKEDSVMFYSIPASLTSNNLNIQEEHALTAKDIFLIRKSFQLWNDLNVGIIGTTYNPGSAVKNRVYLLQQAISLVASDFANMADGLISLDITTARELHFDSMITKMTQLNIGLYVETQSD